MVFGSMVAGATSEGGAAVAFPVMTLVFGIAPPVARDFSFMIQSVGMTCASFTILFMGKCHWCLSVSSFETWRLSLCVLAYVLFASQASSLLFSLSSRLCVHASMGNR